MYIKKNYSLAIVDIKKIEEINKIVIKYAAHVQEHSIYYYFNLNPLREEDINMDLTLFRLEAESESGLNKKLKELIEDLDQLNTEYAIRDEDTQEMIVEIEQVLAIHIDFSNVKFLKKGTYEKLDELNHLKTEFGICKIYNPNFRPIEDVSIENTDVKPETVYLFSDTEENLSKLKAFISEKIMEIDPDFKIEMGPFLFVD